MNLASIQQGIKKLQWFEYLKGVFLEILNALLCRVFANQVTYNVYTCISIIDNIVPDRNPTIRQLWNLGIIKSVAIKWYELGLMLLDDSQQLDIIKANHVSDVTKCCHSMFTYWLNTCPTASWYGLVDALRATGVDMNAEATKLENKWCMRMPVRENEEITMATSSL